MVHANDAVITPAIDPVDRSGFAPAPTIERFSFTGSGREYFGIWIVNLLLSILTLGIYSAWAKVRKTRYFYDNTRLAGTGFDYHGNPVAILKGRIAAVAMIAGYNLAFRYSPYLGVAILALLIAVTPWLVWKSLQFKLYNSSYRGIRFGFRGSLGESYKYYLLLPILGMITLYIAMPFVHQRIKKYQHNESRFGKTHFSFDATAGSFYIAYLIGFVIMMAGVVVLSVLFFGSVLATGLAGSPSINIELMGGTFVLYMVALYAWMFSIFPIFLTIIQNLIWNNTRLSAHQFKSEMKWGRMLFIAITNLLGIALTLGLYTPFAQIRAMKYRIESMSLLPSGSLDEFIADTTSEVSATSEGMADLLDFDLSL